MDNLPRLAAAPSESLVTIHGVITTASHNTHPRTLTISDESGSVTAYVSADAIGGLVVNNGQAHLVGTRVTVVGLRLDATGVRASNIALDTAPLTGDALDALLATASTGAALSTASLLALPAAPARRR
ncbi:hypothetical protein [Kitasatospora sp. CB01950]|uniref:hypothetical protein n=1 Tax=Kitasatospora sp. CB01950 TaxID=1703930 RepID=UPI00093F3D29|nr:hypothetical protein [Kitasatospora sp. CB01950]OKI95085.1 hypothetical protein AMK19_32970 [Kitasatospora sp. CB01950]